MREEEEEVLLGHEMGTQAHEEEGRYPLPAGHRGRRRKLKVAIMKIL